MAFHEIPFSEIEAQLMVGNIGAWRNFDDLEDCLILDELLMLHDQMVKAKHDAFKLQVALAGGTIDDDEYEEADDEDELPPDVIAAEREWQKKKKEAIQSGRADKDELSALGIGHTKS